MGQTLTHGIYLPDEGERNCYSGLAANWQLLDSSVGTIAEHTSALSEKAPLVHTHSKADITDFPALATVATSGSYNDLSNIPASFTPASHTHGNITNDGKVGTTADKPLITGTGGVVQAGSFGNQANTFCEGNDSRLSDARTPVAHTHTKSDVTDLFNSDFIPSANNSYNLGSSTYQWNNLYAKNYYYNGTAWGLDKENVWTTNQIISSSSNKSFTIKNTAYTLGETTPSANKVIGSLAFKDFNNENAAYIDIGHYVSGEIYSRWLARYKFANGVKSTTGATVNAAVDLGLTNSGDCFFRPYSNGSHELGDSTHKWKSLNGINPGALSLPSGGTTENTDWFNVAGDILPTGRNATDFTGGQNFFTPAKDGWLALTIIQCSSISVWCDTLKYGMSVAAPDASLNRQLIVPVVANMVYEIRISGNSWFSARLIMPKGNV